MIKDENSLLKSTFLLGSTQAIKIIIGVASTKLTAIFLGPSGVGILGLLNNIINLITTLTGLGIEFSGVREVSIAKARNDVNFFSRKILLLRRLMLLCAVLSALIMIVFSKQLSIWCFNDKKHSFWFIALSIVFFFNALRAFYNVVLQGAQELKLLAKSWLYASLFTTIVSGIIYYFLRIDGILYVFISTAVINMIAGYYCFKKIKINHVKISFQDFKTESMDFIKLGITFSINSFLSLGCMYLIRLYISKTASINSLGFYEAGITFSTYYVSFIFTAMTADFYPKLTAVNNDTIKINSMVNKQIALTILIVTPAILFLYSTAPLLVELLYSKQFYPVIDILKGISLAMVLKSVSWPLAYIVLAKGDRKTFFFQELFADSANLILTIILFNFFGLLGVGIAQIFVYLFYGIYMYFTVLKRYKFMFEDFVKKIIIYNLLLAVFGALIVYFIGYPNAFFIVPPILFLSLFLSYKTLNKHFGLSISKFINKK